MIPCIAAIAVHVNGIQGSWQFDDHQAIVTNPAIHSWAAWVADLPGGIRPLLKATYTLNWTSGLGLAGFHIVNIAIHAGASVLACVLAVRVCAPLDRRRPGAAVAAATIAATLFAIHPVQTEAVTYVSGRSASLMALLYMAALWTHDLGCRSDRRLLAQVASPLLFVAAALVKEPAVTLPAALLLWALLVRGERNPLRMAREQGVHWILVVIVLALIFTHPHYGSLFTASLESRSLEHNLLSQINGVSYLVSRLVLFARLNFDPDLPIFIRWHPVLVMQAVALFALLATAVLQWRRRPWLAFGILWFFLQLAPMTTLIPRTDLVNERHLYLASAGLFIATAGLLVEWALRSPVHRRTASATIGMLLLALAVATPLRNLDYRSEVALWSDTVAKSPYKARAHNNLGYALREAGRLDEARKSYQRALELDPGLGGARQALERLRRQTEWRERNGS